MTNAKAKLVSTDIIATAPATAATQPQVIVITERTHVGFAAAAVLIRSGWMMSPDFAPEIYPSTGQCTITLQRGNPDAQAVAIAEAAEAYAVATTARDFDKAVEAAAARQIDLAAKQAKQAEIAAVVAANKAQIAKLEAEIAAA
jgi:hypothetical protein